jgi:hypothetical protein
MSLITLLGLEHTAYSCRFHGEEFIIHDVTARKKLISALINSIDFMEITKDAREELAAVGFLTINDIGWPGAAISFIMKSPICSATEARILITDDRVYWWVCIIDDHEYDMSPEDYITVNPLHGETVRELDNLRGKNSALEATNAELMAEVAALRAQVTELELRPGGAEYFAAAARWRARLAE